MEGTAESMLKLWLPKTHLPTLSPVPPFLKLASICPRSSIWVVPVDFLLWLVVLVAHPKRQCKGGSRLSSSIKIMH